MRIETPRNKNIVLYEHKSLITGFLDEIYKHTQVILL